VYLPPEVFRTVVASTPLVAIDLVVEDRSGRVLLGRRNNRPAQGYWFVPGGRIQKNEMLDAAFVRLTSVELGAQAERAEARLLGVYEHLYTDSVFGDTPDTHYVVLAYHLPRSLSLDSLPAAQHNDYRWWGRQEMALSEQVHANSRAYLSELPPLAAAEE
jgi:colanic acid biosynthesis protein WcaH